MGKRVQAAQLPRVAAIYVRVSTPGQGDEDKDSLKTQQAACRSWCAENAWVVDEAHVYVDMHSGEEWFERPRLRALLDAAKRRAFGIVIATSVDRLTRNASHMVIILDELERTGVALDFVTEKLDDTPEGRLILNIRSYAGELENARRRERMLRNMRARVERGKPNPSNRPTYGYDWADERDDSGRLLKLHMVERPATAAIVRRIWHGAVINHKTLRAIANELTAEGVPTPTGKARWNPSTMRSILANGIYYGHPVALKTQSVPVPRNLRGQYAHKNRRVPRPVDERVPLPPTFAPALVPEAWGAIAAERLRLNREMATRNNQHVHTIASLLRGGYVRCGYCGGAMYSNAFRSRRGIQMARYRCKNGNRTRGQCSAHGIEVSTLDEAVWCRLLKLLCDPALIQHEVEEMARRDVPHADTLTTIEARIAELNRKSANLARVAELLDNPDDAADLAAQIAVLANQRRGLESERTALQVHTATWQDIQDGLLRVMDWADRITKNAATLSYGEKRAVLAALKVDVRLYRADHSPRVTVKIHLPLSGAVPLEFCDGKDDCAHCDDTRTRAPGNSRRAVRA